MGDLTEVDPVAVARAYLLTRSALTDMLGGDHIGSHNEPPYPCVVLSDPPGNDRFLQHLLAPLLQVEVIGDVDGTQGKPLLRRILYRVLSDLVSLPEQPTAPGEPVVTSVTSTGGGGWVPLPNGQPRYLGTVQMFMHPPHPSYAAPTP